MTPLHIAIKVAVSVGIPLAFLFLIYSLDLYASRVFKLVMYAFVWGASGGLFLAYLFNTYVALPLIATLGLSDILLYVLFAPITEELLKSASLLWLSRRSEFTYFVDGAIYGFAAGIGFSIFENILYIFLLSSGEGIGTFIVRAFSTCLMHGTAAALVGVALGRFRFQKQARVPAMVGGWTAAILLHMFFNGVATSSLSVTLTLILLIATGLTGVGIIGLFIMLGLREQKQWMAQTLGLQAGVTDSEVRVAQSYGNIDELLAPIFEQFPLQAKDIEQLLLLEAQMGIKKRVQQQVDDPKLQADLEREVAEMREKVKRLQKKIGSYIMIYVRLVIPAGMLDVWTQIIERMQSETDTGVLVGRWAEMLASKKEEPDRQGRGVFDHLMDQE